MAGIFKRTLMAFCVAFPSLSFSSLATAEMDQTLIVSKEEADMVVGQFIEKHSFKENLDHVTSISPVYDFYEERIAYYYEFDNQYVLVAANKEYSPVLAAGEGQLRLAELDGSGKLYYSGGIDIIKATNGESIITEIEEQTAGSARSANERQFALTKNPEAQRKWDSYLSASATASYVIAPMALSEKKLTVTTFDQYGSGVNVPKSACGPTTMAAISEYWRTTKGYTLIPSISSYGSKDATINHFYSNHGGTLLGMAVNSLTNGLESHIGEFYSSADASTITGYTSYRSEIVNNRPVAIKFDTKFTFFEPDNDYAYNYHWTVGKGYAYDTFDSMFIINDNTGTSQEHYIDFPTNEPILSLVKFTI